MTQKNFSFRYEWLESMDSLAEDEQVEVLQAIAHFSRTGIAMELSYYANEVFVNYILPTLMKRRKAAESRARARARRAEADARAKREETEKAEKAEDAVHSTAEVNEKPAAGVVAGCENAAGVDYSLLPSSRAS